MKSKKIYRIELKEADSIFTDCILMAATSNGGQYKPLSQIADHADWLCEKYPNSGSVHSVTRIGDNVLMIDKGTQNVLTLTEVEIMDLIMPQVSAQDARDILATCEAPTLNRYAGTGIDNPDFKENLN